jgi:hypothetical protein
MQPPPPPHHQNQNQSIGGGGEAGGGRSVGYFVNWGIYDRKCELFYLIALNQGKGETKCARSRPLSRLVLALRYLALG